MLLQAYAKLLEKFDTYMLPCGPAKLLLISSAEPDMVLRRKVKLRKVHPARL